MLRARLTRCVAWLLHFHTTDVMSRGADAPTPHYTALCEVSRTHPARATPGSKAAILRPQTLPPRSSSGCSSRQNLWLPSQAACPQPSFHSPSRQSHASSPHPTQIPTPASPAMSHGKALASPPPRCPDRSLQLHPCRTATARSGVKRCPRRSLHASALVGKKPPPLCSYSLLRDRLDPLAQGRAKRSLFFDFHRKQNPVLPSSKSNKPLNSPIPKVILPHPKPVIIRGCRS